LAITDVLAQGDDIGDLLASLHIATWLKWGTIAVSVGGFALGLLIDKRYFKRLLVLSHRLVSAYIGCLVVMLSRQS
jgi:hypothetical protein